MLLALNSVLAWIIDYKYVMLFPAAVIEGPIITILAGFLVAHGYLYSLVAYGILVAGDLTGDSCYYALGRWGLYRGATTEQLNKVKKHFANHSGKTLLVGKLTHGIGSIILMAAGAAGIPYRRFLWFNLLGTIPKTFVLLIVGFYFGQAYLRFNHYLNYLALSVVMLSAAGLLAYPLIIKRFTT